MEQLVVEFTKEIAINNVILTYVFFFISQALQVIFPPYPGDMILILEGYIIELANFKLVLVTTNAILATFLSSILLYNIGNIKEDRILHSKLINYLFDMKKISKIRNLFDKHGAAFIIFSKFIPGIYSITVLSAGIFKVRKKNAYLGILITNLIHHIVLILLGKKLGENWTIIFYKLNSYSRYIIAIGIIGFIAYLILLKIKKKLLE